MKTNIHTSKWDRNLDVVIAAPRSHEILLENDKVRVVKVTIMPHQKEPFHNHKWSSIMIVYNSTRLRYFDKNGKFMELPKRNVSPENPFVEWLDPEKLHAVENLDAASYNAIRIEIKQQSHI